MSAGRWGAFPSEWGLPEGPPMSEARAAWVRRQVTAHMAATEVRATTGRAALAALARRREATAEPLRGADAMLALADLIARRRCP